MSFRNFLLQKVFKYVPDTLWVKFKYYSHFKKPLDLKAPKTFNEKLQWLKLYYQKPSHTRMVDKYEMKGYVDEQVGPGYVVPLLGVWDTVEDIDFDALPDQFVLKVTHDCAGLVICTDKSKLDREKAKEKLRKALKHDYYLYYREWPYKHVVPRILAEKYMVDESGTQLRDYKLHCFGGKVKLILLCQDRFESSGMVEDFFTENWEWVNVKRPNIPNAKITAEKPEQLEQMIEIAEKIAGDEPFVRVDFYCVEGKPYVGEITFFPASGYGKFVPEEYDKIYGDQIILPEKIITKG